MHATLSPAWAASDASPGMVTCRKSRPRGATARTMAGALVLACTLQGTAAALAQPDAGSFASSAPASDPVLERALGVEVERYREADRVAPPASCQILFVGSSSIVKWKPTLVADLAPLPVLDRGFGGSHIEYVNRWFDELVTPYRPRAIVFYAGENDIDAGKSVERVIADFDAFMYLKSRALGDTPVYFISLKPSKLRFAEFARQSQVNAAIRARARERSDLHYIDVVAPMLENGKPKDIYESDGLHMTAKGYAIWTRLVRAALLPSAEAEARRCRAGVGTAHANAWPYDEKADAPADVQRALTAASADHRDVLLVFGANWCADCRALDKAMRGSSQRLIAGEFHVVKIDVGNFDKNLDLARRYGNPIVKGIPAVVVLSADSHVIYSTKGGELADARRMGEQGIYDFLSQKVVSAQGASR
jgi:thiol-disulfide isomerase/thioredoxin